MNIYKDQMVLGSTSHVIMKSFQLLIYDDGKL